MKIKLIGMGEKVEDQYVRNVYREAALDLLGKAIENLPPYKTAAIKTALLRSNNLYQTGAYVLEAAFGIKVPLEGGLEKAMDEVTKKAANFQLCTVPPYTSLDFLGEIGMIAKKRYGTKALYAKLN